MFIIVFAGTAEGVMAESVHKVIEFVGTSAESWEKAVAAAVELAPGKAYVICGLARSPNSM